MIPKQAKKRQPDELVLATFRIPYEKWEKFQEAANAAGTTASATLLAFIEDYLAEAPAGSEAEVEAEVPTQLDALVLDPTKSKLESQSEIKIVTELNSDLKAEIKQQIEDIVHLNINEFQPSINAIQTQVSQLSLRLDQVELIVSKLNRAKQEKASELIDVNAVPIDRDLNRDDLEIDEEPGEDYEIEVGLTQTALCTEFGINPYSLNRHAKMRGLSNMEYLHQLTGWVYRQGKYYPPQ